MSGAKRNGETESEAHRAGPLEIAATAVSGLLIVAVVAVLVWDASREHTPPAFRTSVGDMTATPRSYRAPISVTNTGDESAKSVVVHVELVAGDSTLAESDIIIDWLPGNSRREVVSFFAPPSGATATGVRAEVRGYATP
jgi:uncharacterized protein (TIGR02588 family)